MFTSDLENTINKTTLLIKW